MMILQLYDKYNIIWQLYNCMAIVWQASRAMLDALGKALAVLNEVNTIQEP
jgi:hypothetical protein